MSDMSAAQIIQQAETVLLDETGVRWPYSELLDWINDAIKAIIINKPNAYSINTVMKLQAGTYQTLPEGALTLLRVVRNLNNMPTTEAPARSGGRAIRIVSRDVLDSQEPNWHDTTRTPAKSVVKHFMMDEQDPFSFYVYPPNDGTGIIELVVAEQPAALALPAGADATAISSYSSLMLPLPGIYDGPVLDYVLYRAYFKDAQFAGNSQRAAMCYQQFANTLGIKVKLDAAYSPNVPSQTKAS